MESFEKLQLRLYRAALHITCPESPIGRHLFVSRGSASNLQIPRAYRQFGIGSASPASFVSASASRVYSSPECRHILLSSTLAAAVLRAFYAICCFVYWLALHVLPLSRSSLLLAAQLAFSAVLAFFFGSLRHTPFSINAIVLLSIGPTVLGVGPGSGRPAGQSSSTYWMGF